ncbi:hypothetical protein [Streptomyces sp. NBC_01233]|uniref:hypothetical protein n=1 Tax=Streptomyces sp. NBC_01233 TaxID=2903787 RepID=UPI002E121A7F|nr:hypothetical protein OG332_11050 [Streptomyces sp. NBC_01233]
MAAAAQQQAERTGPLEPVPVSGCGVCLALVTAREIAREVGDRCAVAVQNAELRNHPHRQSQA